MTWAEAQRRYPEAVDAFDRLLRDEQDGSVPYDREAWSFVLTESGGLVAVLGIEEERWVWADPDWLDDND